MKTAETYQQKIKLTADYLNASNNVLFITGAGISAESGLPTYRGIGGLYNDDLTEDNMPIEEALSGYMMSLKPDITWKYISKIEEACRGASYNRAHAIIAEMEPHFERLFVLTQNVDGFHNDAGSVNVIDIHGNIRDLQCTNCFFRLTVADYSELSMPPKCPDCSSVLRPDVVLFGEFLQPEKTSALYTELEKGFDVVFSIGTSSVFPYISGPVLEASKMGIPTIEINPADSEISSMVTVKFSEKAGTVMEDIWQAVKKD